MIRLNANTLEITAGLIWIVSISALVAWLLMHKKPTPEERERARRKFLVQSGRILDGMLLDLCEIEAPAKVAKKSKHQSTEEPPRILIFLLYSYRIGGVDYECSQEITDLRDVVDASSIRAGFPCSARYQPGNPQNSIVVAEEWSGLREGLPVLPSYDDPDPVDTSHLDLLHPGRG